MRRCRHSSTFVLSRRAAEVPVHAALVASDCWQYRLVLVTLMQPPRRFFSVPSYKWGGYSLHDVQHTSADMSTQVSAISAGFFVLSNALWGVYFWRDSWHSLEYIFGFLFITTWLVPFSLFLSVAANESVLPGGANAGMTFSSSTNNLTGDKSSFLAKSIALSLCCVAHLDPCCTDQPCHHQVPSNIHCHIHARMSSGA